MSENINFIPAAELPIAETKDVDVLCVENGELKRKAGANLGGGGYVIKVPATALDSEMSPNEDGSVNIIMESAYDEVAEVLSAGGSVWVDFSDAFAAMGLKGIALAGLAMSWGFSEDLDNLFYLRATVSMLGEGMGAMLFNVLFPNGTWRPESEG